MIKPSELRIGILVDYEGAIIHLDEDRMQVLFAARNYNDFHPIPITEERLLKFGFEVENTNGGFLKWQKGNFKLLDGRLPDPQFHSPKAIIKYVHQLQNLYFVLTGEELTITP